MKGQASVKVPEGKLVKVETHYDEEKLTNVKVRGDFFIEPPEALKEIEDALTGLKIDSEKEALKEAIKKVEADLIGFSAASVAEAVKKSIGESK